MRWPTTACILLLASCGAHQLSDGLSTAAAGSHLLAGGLQQARNGAPRLKTGANELSKRGVVKIVHAGQDTA